MVYVSNYLLLYFSQKLVFCSFHCVDPAHILLIHTTIFYVSGAIMDGILVQFPIICCLYVKYIFMFMLTCVLQIYSAHLYA